MANAGIVERVRRAIPEAQRSQIPDAPDSVDPTNVVPRIVVVETADTELRTLKDLQAFVTERIRSLQGVDIRNVMTTLRAFEDGPKHPDSKRMLHELRTRAWGKAVLVRPVEGNGPIKTFRITQANYGAPKLGVIARGAPVAEQLVSVQLGDEVRIPAGTFEVIGVAHFEPDTDPENFRRMDLGHFELPERVWLEDVARQLRLRVEELLLLFRGETVEAPLAAPPPEVQRTDIERLGAHFYTRATALQEVLMRSDEGLAAVIGVAGSGKTSVALGRTKMLIDRVPEEDEPSLPFFRSETAMGFVLTGQLCDYLEKTCQQLALYDMPVQEFHQLRARLFELRRLDETGFEHATNEATHPLVGTMAWLRAADISIARLWATGLVEAVRDPPKERESAKKVVAKRSPEQEAALGRLWSDMVRGIEGVAASLGAVQQGARFHLERLVSKVDAVRRKFATELERAKEFTGPDNKELRQNIRSALRERIVRALRLPEAYSEVLSDSRATAYSAEVLRLAKGATPADASSAVAEAMKRLSDRKLTSADIDVLLGLAHVLSTGYRGRDDRDPISHLTEADWYSQVFIDEFQDFSEVQLFLMGAQANPERRTVTVVGDYAQKLHPGRRIDLAAAFPWSDESQARPGVLLENKRQTGWLAGLSQRFREEVLGDRPDTKIEFQQSGDRARAFHATADDLHEAIQAEVLRLPRHHSVAVICPTDSAARDLERALRDALGTSFRDTRHSKRGDLLRRYYVHFTTPAEAKGLEFDAAVVLAPESYDLNDPIQANACYVAISRPRKSLSLVGDLERLDPRWAPVLSSDLLEQIRST